MATHRLELGCRRFLFRKVWTVRLILMRHAMAAMRGPWADADRPLTSDGEEQAQQSATGLACLDLQVSNILCSPATRCRSTADIVASTLGIASGNFRATDALSLGTTLANVVDLLQMGDTGATVLWVGHQPVLERFAATLLFSEGEFPMHLTPAACLGLHCNLRDPPPAAVLLWFMRSHELGMLRCDSSNNDA